MEEQMILQQPAQPQTQAVCAPPKPEIKRFDRVFVLIAAFLGFLFVRYSLFNFNGFFTSCINK